MSNSEMKYSIPIGVLLIGMIVTIGCSPAETLLKPFTNIPDDDRMLIVIAAPSVEDEYYAEVFDQIIEYDVAFASAVMAHDNVIVVADKNTIPYLAEKLPDDILLEGNIADIWARDFTTASPARMVQFKYQPQYLDATTSRFIQSSFDAFAARYDLQLGYSNLVLDGGNVVDNNHDKAVVTTRVLEDNPRLSRDDIVAELKAVLGVNHIAIIPEEPEDTTGHADGMVMWVSEDTLLVNTYDEPFRSQVLVALEDGFPNTQVIEVEQDFSRDEWSGFISACGLNVNSLVTNNYIYIPIFGNPADGAFIETVRQYTSKQIITINADSVCFMGGSVRCLSWQVTGENAHKLIEAARK